jgi:C1A family cysteine protease
MNVHNKQYKSDTEFLIRFNIFKDNLAIIRQLNSESNISGSATFAVNKFADISALEFKHLYLMTNLPPYTPTASEVPTLRAGAPTTWDWRTKSGVITAVKDQGQCGSCWAFSATENIESSAAILLKKNAPVLGPQQMVDCTDTCYGCGGGWPYLAFQDVIKRGGEDTESTYPYTARDGTCKFQAGGVGAVMSEYKSFSNGKAMDEAVLQSSISDPAAGSAYSICVDAASWQFYHGGVMTPTQCGKSVDHCTQLVGYDATSTTLPFWIVRNSWGTDWGVSGFIQLQMFKNTCLVAQYVTNAIVTK